MIETKPASFSSSSLAIKRMSTDVSLLSWAGYCAITIAAIRLCFCFLTTIFFLLDENPDRNFSNIFMIYRGPFFITCVGTTYYLNN